MTKKKGEFTVLRNIRAGMVIILLIYIGLIFLRETAIHRLQMYRKRLWMRQMTRT